MKLISKIIIAVAIFLAGFYIGNQNALSPSNGSVNQESNQEMSANLVLDYGDGKIQEFENILVKENQNIFEFLKQVANDNNIELSYKDYGSDLGVFVESIGGLENNFETNYFWQYWINGEYAQMGPSSYNLQNGDKIEWRYSDDQFN